MRIFFLLFVVVPVLEVWLLIKIGSAIGAIMTIVWLFLAAVIGINLIRYQGVATLMSINQQIQKGEVPAQSMAEGMLIGIAGVLLIIPGFASDFLALILLVPLFRRRLLASWLRKVKVKTAYQGNIYEGESEVSNSSSVHEQGSKKIHKVGRTLEGEYRREDK